MAIVAQGDELLVGVLLLHLVEYARLGSHNETLGVAGLDIVEHGLGRTDKVGHLEQCRVALGVGNDRRVVIFGLQSQHRLGLHGVVHGAHTVPQQHLAAGHLVDIAAQVAVGREDNLLLLGQRAHQLLGVAAGAYKVAEGLDFSRAVDVAYHHVVGVLGLELGKVVGLAALGQRAAGFHVGQQHLAARVENLGRLGHEMHAAEDNDVGRGLLGPLCQRQAVAYVVGKLLYLVTLVVVTQYHGVFLALQAQYFLLQFLVGHTHIGVVLKVQRYEKKQYNDIKKRKPRHFAGLKCLC